MKWLLFSILGLGAGAVVFLVSGHKQQEQQKAMTAPTTPGGPPAPTTPGGPPAPTTPGGPPDTAGPGDSVPITPDHSLTPAEVVARADVRYTDPVPEKYMDQAKAMLKRYGAIVVRLAPTFNRGGPCDPSDDYAPVKLEWLIAYDDQANMVGCEIAIPHPSGNFSKTL